MRVDVLESLKRKKLKNPQYFLLGLPIISTNPPKFKIFFRIRYVRAHKTNLAFCKSVRVYQNGYIQF